MEEWYYQKADTEAGPIGEDDLKKLHETGVISSETPVRQGGSEISRSYAEAFPPRPATLAAQPPPLPPAVPRATAPAPIPAPVALAPVPAATFGPTLTLWTFALLALAAIVAVAILHIVFGLYALLILGGVSGIPGWFTRLTDTFNEGFGWFSALLILSLIIWQGSAFGSLIRRYEPGMVPHSKASGFWWITPVANLFVPFMCLKQMRWLSRERRRMPQPSVPAGAQLWTLEIAILLNAFTTVLDKIVSAIPPQDSEETITTTIATVVNLASHIVGVCLMSLLGFFILRNLIQQVLLHRHWHAAPPPAVAAA